MRRTEKYCKRKLLGGHNSYYNNYNIAISTLLVTRSDE